MRLLPAIVLALAVAACGGEDAGTGEVRRAVPETVTGVITEIDTEGSEVTGFTLRADDAETWDIAIDPEVDYGFDLAHLADHRDTGDPVEVRLRDDDGRAVALQIDDA